MSYLSLRYGVSAVKPKLAQELINLRGEKSLYEVSMACGIHRDTLRKYEAGLKVPEDKNLEILAAFYQVPFSALKILRFDDLYPVGSRDRQILCEWLHQIGC